MTLYRNFQRHGIVAKRQLEDQRLLPDLQIQALNLEPDDLPQLEADFIKVAASYGERKNISYSTWREFGVSGDVFKAAGVKRSRRPYGNS